MPTFFQMQNRIMNTLEKCVADFGHIFFPYYEINNLPFQGKKGKGKKWQHVKYKISVLFTYSKHCQFLYI